MTLKRLLHRKSFWVVLILLPILLFGIAKSEQSSDKTLTAVVCCKEESLIPILKAINNPVFFFVETEEEVKELVLQGKAECGYVIPEDLQESFEKEDWYWRVEVYEGAHSMFTELINEVLFSRIFERVSIDWYEEFIESNLVADVADISEKVREQLTEIFANEETFHVQIIRLADETENAQRSEEAEEKEPEAGRISSKGIVAVMLYLMSLLAVMDVTRDREKRYFKRSMQFPSAFWTISHPIALIGVSGFAALLTTGNLLSVNGGWDLGRLLQEVAAYIGLLCITVIYALLLCLLIRKSDWLYGLIPVFFLAGLVCCPVFVDLGVFFPIFNWIKWLFPFAFYL